MNYKYSILNFIGGITMCKKDDKCVHCAFIDAPHLCENYPCEMGLMMKDNEKIKMEKWNEIYDKRKINMIK